MTVLAPYTAESSAQNTTNASAARLAKIARIPTRDWASRFIPRSTTPREVTARRDASAAATRKLAALIATPTVGDPTTRTSPPIAGPRTTTTFSIAAKSAFAATNVFSGTISGVSAPAAGWYGAD